MAQRIMYDKENPPTKGTAKKIWNVLVNAGLDPYDLHFNPGPRSADGSGTWACAINNDPFGTPYEDYVTGLQPGEYWCGIRGKTMVYIEGMVAPFDGRVVGFVNRSCPFYYQRKYTEYSWKSVEDRKIYSKDKTISFMACKCPSMNGKLPEGKCPCKCDDCNDEFLMERNEEYARCERRNQSDRLDRCKICR